MLLKKGDAVVVTKKNPATNAHLVLGKLFTVVGFDGDYLELIDDDSGYKIRCKQDDVKLVRPCRNPQCATSTAIDDALSFGWGELNGVGVWEHGCRVCAAAYDERQAAIREEVKSEMKANLMSRGVKEEQAAEQADEYIRNAEWLNLPAHPRK